MSRLSARALVALGLTCALAGAACSNDSDDKEQSGAAETTTTTVAKGTDTPAALVRSDLDSLLSEHVVLAAAATGAALGSRPDEFAAAKTALDGNSDSLTKLIAAVFGDEAGAAFDPLWKKHIDLFVKYTQGDGGAYNELIAYATEFGAFIHSALPDLPTAAVADLVKEHVDGLKAVIDAQKAGDDAEAYTALRSAYAHMDMIAKPLAAAMHKTLPDKVGGDPESPAVNLLVTLDSVLAEHSYLVALTTGAALGGRTDEFTAASAALDANSNAITAAIASVYGAPAGTAFDPLWKKHIGFFKDYTTAKVAKDQTKADAAIDALLAYAKEFGAFINSASPELPTDTVAGLVTTHVYTLKQIIDNQASGDEAKTYQSIREAAAHMDMIAGPLAAAIVKQFPDKF